MLLIYFTIFSVVRRDPVEVQDDVADGTEVPEEEGLDSGGPDLPEGGQEVQQVPKSGE